MVEGLKMEILIFILVVTTLMSIPIWLMLIFIKNAYFWEYGISFYGVVFWSILTYFNIGGGSLTNAFLEPIFINFVAILLVFLRFLLSKYARISSKQMSAISIILVVLFSVLIKFAIPILPE